MSEFEQKFKELRDCIVNDCVLYVEDAIKYIEKVFMYGVIDDEVHFDMFYKVNGEMSKNFEVNDYLPWEEEGIDNFNSDCFVDVCMDWLKDIKKLCMENGKDCPKELYLIYDVQNKVLHEKYNYFDEYCKGEEAENVFKDKFNKWFKEAKTGMEAL